MRTLQWKVWLKDVLTITEITLKWLRVLTCLRILKPSSHFHWTHSGTDHCLVNFWLGSLFFLVMTSWFSFCCLKQWFPKPVNKFWDLQNLSTFQFFFLQLSRSFLMFDCLLGEKWPALASLSRKNKQAGIRNSPVQGAYSTCPPPPPPKQSHKWVRA